MSSLLLEDLIIINFYMSSIQQKNNSLEFLYLSLDSLIAMRI